MAELLPKRVLLISGFRIFPGSTGGHIHTGGIARSLARMGYRVLIYSLAGRKQDYGLNALWAPSYRLDQIEPNLVEETNLGLFIGLIQAVGRRLDVPRVWQYALLKLGLVPKRLKLALRDADIILSDLPWCPPVRGPWRSKPWFLVSHNLEYSLLAQENALHRRFSGWMLGVESAAPQTYNDIFSCAEEDRDFFRLHGRGSQLALPIIRCGVDPGGYSVPAGTREEVRASLGLGDSDTLLVFSGSRFGPNLDALAWLREFCLTEAEFLARHRIFVLVLGSMVAKPERNAALIATGRVPATEPYFAAGDAGLNPITRGSGSNVKLFEYLAARLPVISTEFGVRGTELRPEVDYLGYEQAGLRATLEQFVTIRSREQWREFAEAVWTRHRKGCDIGELVRDAIAKVPGFPAP
jgi:glycosyltransferase involved in cell wall biosynthesis